MFKISRIVATSVIVLILVLTACARFLGSPDRADRASTDRLNAQAQAVQEQAREQRANDAYTARLMAQAEAYLAQKALAEQANQAWTDRLNGLAGQTGMSQRASDAWTDRLNGLAEQYAADR